MSVDENWAALVVTLRGWIFGEALGSLDTSEVILSTRFHLLSGRYLEQLLIGRCRRSVAVSDGVGVWCGSSFHAMPRPPPIQPPPRPLAAE